MNTLKAFGVVLSILFLFASPTINGQDMPKEIQLAASGDAYLNGVSKAVGEKAFGKHGIKFALKDYPKARALANANSGKADGDAYRVLDFHKRTKGKYPNLKIVNETFVSIYWTAFVREDLKDRKINGWEDMKNFRVAGIRGNKTMEFRFNEHLNKDQQYIVNDYDQAFAMLMKGRVDMVIAKPSVGISYKKKYKNLYALGKFEVQDLYFYLHQKHQHIIPKIESSIREMRQDGLLVEIEKKVRDSL